jgi:deoxyribodipyrimidine photolyase-like uncharacterized protein
MMDEDLLRRIIAWKEFIKARYGLEMMKRLCTVDYERSGK